MLDISGLTWGVQPVPLLPSSLQRLWRDEKLPAWLVAECGLRLEATISSLGADYWDATSQISPRVEHFVHFLVRTRSEAIKTVRCFDLRWPRGLDILDIPLSVRSTRRLALMGFVDKPDAVMEVTFGDLLAFPGLGVKSLIEITSVLETAVGVYWQLAAEFAHSVAVGAPISVAPTSAEAPAKPDDGRMSALYDILREPWAEQISDKDPRFRQCLLLGDENLGERVERLISDAAVASGEIPRLLDSFPAIRKTIARVNSHPLEDNLLELLSGVIGSDKSRLRVIAARLGWLGEDPMTLQGCGDQLGVTRERVRQIENKVRKRLPKYSIYLPKLDLGLSVLEAASPVSILEGSRLLMEHGVSRNPFSVRSLLDTAELFGRKTTLSIQEIKGQHIVASAAKGKAFGTVIRLARKRAGEAGVASVFQIVDSLNDFDELDDLLGLESHGMTEVDVRRILSGLQGCEFLDQDWFWFTDIPEGHNRLENISKRILSVASPQSISSIREGITRAYRWRSKSNVRYRSLVVPPQGAIASFFERHPDFRIDNNVVSTVKPLDYRSLLGEGERVLVDVLRSSSTGVLDRKTLADSCLAQGINENTFSVYTTYSPIIEHLGLDLWKLRGVRVDPAAVEAVREQNQLRPRESRTLNFGWSPEGRLWIAWRLPATRGSPTFGVPSPVHRYLCDRTFLAFGQDAGRSMGQVSVTAGGTSYGFAPFIRYVGADAGDTLRAEFDLKKSDVELSIVENSVLEED
jgi:hypothetical protein